MTDRPDPDAIYEAVQGFYSARVPGIPVTNSFGGACRMPQRASDPTAEPEPRKQSGP
jgi:hypothetical protein